MVGKVKNMSKRSNVEKVLIHEVMLMAYQEGIEEGRKRALKELANGEQQTEGKTWGIRTGPQTE